MDGGEVWEDGAEGGSGSEGGEEAAGEVAVGARRSRSRRKGGGGGGEAKRDWIVRKKAQQRSRGYTNIKPDTKYTGRKRKDRF